MASASKTRSPNPYLTVGKVARTCGVSNRTVINWIARGQLQASRLPGGHYRIHTDVLRAFLATRRPQRPGARRQASGWPLALCWNDNGRGMEHRCGRCIVFRAHVVHCFLLREVVEPSLMGCEIPCDRCQHFQAVYREVSDGLELDSMPCLVSRGDTLLGANSALRTLLGLDGEQAPGLTWMDFIDPAQRDSVACIAGRIHDSAPDAVLRIEARLVSRRGETIPVTLETTWFPRIAGSVVTRFLQR